MENGDYYLQHVLFSLDNNNFDKIISREKQPLIRISDRNRRITRLTQYYINIRSRLMKGDTQLTYVFQTDEKKVGDLVVP